METQTMDNKTLRQQIPFLSLTGLRDFAARQAVKLTEVKRLIAGAESEIAKIQADAAPFFTGENRLIGNVKVRINSPADTGLQTQVVERKYKVRQALDQQLVPLFKQMLAAKAVAKEYATRHWTKPQVLNRATTGTGATEGLTRRAAYATIFEKIGKAQLFDFGQLAIDTGDAILGDSVYRATMIRPREERPFQPAELIALIPNAEYTEATAILQSVLDTTDAAGLAIASFEGKTGKVSISKIALGLHGQREKVKAQEDLSDDLGEMLDSAGGIRDEWLLKIGKRVSEQQ
jgi:hypothetical protein